MIVQLIKGEFGAKDALNLLTRMIHAEIKYNEEKMLARCNRTERRIRESKIKQLQKDLYEVRNFLERKSGNIILEGHTSFRIKE